MADDIRLICWPTPDRLAIGIQIRNLAGQLVGVQRRIEISGKEVKEKEQAD